MNSEDTEPNAIGREPVRSISKLLFAVLSVLVLLSLVSLLPGGAWVVSATPVSTVALAGAVATLTAVGALLYLAPAFERLVRFRFEGPDAVVEDVAAIVRSAVVFAAVLIAHRGIRPAVTPFLGRFSWMYDVAFLALAVPLLVVLAVRLYVSLDPAADLCAEKLVGGGDEFYGDSNTR